MSEKIKGTNITSPIVPFTSSDNYPTHLAEFGKGGFRCVNTISDLEGISEERLEDGMVVYVRQDPTKLGFYQWVGGIWIAVEKFTTKRIDTLEEIL